MVNVSLPYNSIKKICFPLLTCKCIRRDAPKSPRIIRSAGGARGASWKLCVAVFRKNVCTHANIRYTGTTERWEGSKNDQSKKSHIGAVSDVCSDEGRHVPDLCSAQEEEGDQSQGGSRNLLATPRPPRPPGSRVRRCPERRRRRRLNRVTAEASGGGEWWQ